MLRKIGLDMRRERIEAFHRLNKQSDRTIVKFSRGRDGEHIMQNKKKTSIKLRPPELDLLNGAKLCRNESLCPYNRGQWNECNKLWDKQ